MRRKKTASRVANDSAIDRTAAAWLARRVRGLAPEEDTELSRWLAANPRHAEVFAGLEDTWRSLDGLKGLRLPDGRAFDADLPVPRRGRGTVVYLSAVFAVAAVITFAFIQWERAGRKLDVVQSVVTMTGGFEKLDLPDGSIVRLNTDSAVDVDFTRSERRVQLVRGEATFSVVKDAARPFVVQAGNVAVRAVGTEFNVRLRADAIEVLVTEGKVRVDEKVGPVVGSEPGSGDASRPSESAAVAWREPSRSEHRREVSAGERMVVPAAGGSVSAIAAVPPEEIRRELAWQERKLEFLSTPLAEVVAEFNRYNRHKLIIGDARLKERRFGGAFRADNADAFVRLLESRFDVIAERSEQSTVLRLEDSETK